MTDNELDVDMDSLEIEEDILPGLLDDETEIDPHDSAPEPEEEQ